MADMEIFYDDLITINLYCLRYLFRKLKDSIFNVISSILTAKFHRIKKGESFKYTCTCILHIKHTKNGLHKALQFFKQKTHTKKWLA